MLWINPTCINDTKANKSVVSTCRARIGIHNEQELRKREEEVISR